MILSEQLLLEFRLSLEKLITEREAMIATNSGQESRGESQAYDESSFMNIADKIQGLNNSLVVLGDR